MIKIFSISIIIIVSVMSYFNKHIAEYYIL